MLGAAPGQVGLSRRALGERDEQPVSRELEQLVPGPLRQCDDDALAVRIKDGELAQVFDLRRALPE